MVGPTPNVVLTDGVDMDVKCTRLAGGVPYQDRPAGPLDMNSERTHMFEPAMGGER